MSIGIVSVDVGEGKVLFTHQTPDGVSAEGIAQLADGRFVIERLTLVDPDGVDSRTLRQFQIGWLKAELRELLIEHPEYMDGHAVLASLIRMKQGDESVPAEFLMAEQSVRRAEASLRASAPNRGRGANSEEFYRDIAIGYLHAMETDQGRPVEGLTRHLRESPRHKNLSRSTVSTWIRLSRERGWLTSLGRGRGGGKPGQRLVDYLAEERDS